MLELIWSVVSTDGFGSDMCFPVGRKNGGMAVLSGVARGDSFVLAKVTSRDGGGGEKGRRTKKERMKEKIVKIKRKDEKRN